jgi:glycosyltransferase involved in cell wall biosynthesis
LSGRYTILHLITRLELGGAQQNTLFCTEHHDRDRFRVALVAGRGGILDTDARAIPDADVTLVPWLVHPISPLKDLLAVFRLARIFRDKGADLVHTHSSKAGIAGRLAARLAGVPAVVHTVHGWSFNDTQPAWRRNLYILLERLAARYTDMLVTVSGNDRKAGIARRIGDEDSYRVIRSGIDIGSFRTPDRPAETVRRELGYGPDDILVGMIGNLKPQKGPLDFVRAAAEAHRRDRRIKFLLAGDGPLRAEAEALAKELEAADAIRLLGWRNDVVDLLHAVDIFLLTSLFEGLPRAVLQAMASGTPVIATAVDGTPEVVEHRLTGLLVPPGEPKAAAEAVLRMAGDESLRHRLVEAARKRLGSEFEIHGMVRNLDDLYLSLLEGDGGRS